MIIFLIAFINLALLFADSDEYVLVISFDGFRYDYLEKTETPNFDKFIRNGINAKSLIPVFHPLHFLIIIQLRQVLTLIVIEYWLIHFLVNH